MARHWVKFNVFFETLDDDDEDALFDRIVDAVAEIIDPACCSGDKSPEEPCTRYWTAGSCSIPAIPEDASSEAIDEAMEAFDGAVCPSCGRPFPDVEHRVPRVWLKK